MHGADCRAYFKSPKYAECDAKCQLNNQEYHMCCEVFDYCAFYRTDWFFWITVVFAFLMVMVSCLASVFSCLKLCRRSRKMEQDAESYSEEDTI